MKVFVLINSSSSLPIVDIFFTELEAEQTIPEDIGMQDLAAGVESQTWGKDSIGVQDLSGWSFHEGREERGNLKI